MDKEISDIQLKEEHIHLATIIKGVHKRLRREYRANSQSYEQVWQHHTNNQSSLQLYADAMFRLATEHWSVYPETRIDWCRQVAIEYFHQNGLQKALQKEAKQHFHEFLRTKEKEGISELFPEVNSVPIASNRMVSVFTEPSCLESVATDVGDSDQCFSNGFITHNSRTDGVLSETKISVPLTNKIRLLDVGSCYNPFLCFEEFDVLSIDLSPAKQTVLQCDFLELSTPALPQTLNPLDFDLHNLNSPLKQLPCCSFHVLVFCLLLEYLPSAAQRWQCCVKAHSLLAVNGLLLIVTPDSHSQHRNAPMMKSWKQAIESLGFRRWKYEKKDHIHCMAFRKLAQKATGNVDDTDMKDMLYIPQDFNDACYDDVGAVETICAHESPEDSEEFVKLTMEELTLLGLGDI